MYGGKDYLERQLNDATQGITQAGSTFKPFALVAALEQGISLASVWNGDGPKIFDDFLGRPYEVSNYGNKSFGDVSLLNASAVSINTIYVPLGIKIGVDKVIDAARRAGIQKMLLWFPLHLLCSELQVLELLMLLIPLPPLQQMALKQSHF